MNDELLRECLILFKQHLEDGGAPNTLDRVRKIMIEIETILNSPGNTENELTPEPPPLGIHVSETINADERLG